MAADAQVLPGVCREVGTGTWKGSGVFRPDGNGGLEVGPWSPKASPSPERREHRHGLILQIIWTGIREALCWALGIEEDQRAA